jgi:class 3 adenylate cyclase
MPLFMDRHEVPGASAEDLASAHAADVGVQQNHGVRYLTYWFEAESGSVFCLAEGPDKQAVEDVHREAHGLLATTIIEVEPGPIQRFFGAIPQHPVGHAYQESAVRAVLFTDICSSTELTQALGDEAGTQLVREHDIVVRRALESHGGREVKHTGDGIMGSFSSVSGAVEAAVAIQQDLAERNRDAETAIGLRIGISAGEPVTEDGDLFGAAVQLAARLCSECEPGSITVSVAVRELCIGKRLQFGGVRSVALKGFPEPVQVHDVHWAPANLQAPAGMPVDGD